MTDKPTQASMLREFTEHCRAHPSERFWQALRNWSGHNFILAAKSKDDLVGSEEDTFYWHGKSGRET